MITAISFKFDFNKKFENPDTGYPKQFSTKYIADMIKILEGDSVFLAKIALIVEELNKNLKTKRISEVVKSHLGHLPHVTTYTKKTRTYSIAGLVIHEQD